MLTLCWDRPASNLARSSQRSWWMVPLFQWQQVTQTNIPHPSHACVCNNRHKGVSFPPVKSPYSSLSLVSLLSPLSSFPSAENRKVRLCVNINTAGCLPCSPPRKMVRSAIAHVHFSWGLEDQIGFCVGSALMRGNEKVVIVSWSMKESNKRDPGGVQGGARSVSTAFPEGEGKCIKLCLFHLYSKQGSRFHWC